MHYVTITFTRIRGYLIMKSIPQVQFTCTVLKGSGKTGKLPQDEYGYYTMPIGGLNCYNSAGEYYPYQAAKELFETSSAFMRRMQTGCLKSEEGHPKQQPGQTLESYIQRVMSIEENNVCAHIAEVFLDFDQVKDKNGRPIVAIMGKVKPAGPHGDALQKSFDNPKEEVCFSIRAFTEDKRITGINQRRLVEIVTFDHVTEPGIATARKWHSPALESLNDTTFSRDNIMSAIKPVRNGISMESGFIQPVDLFKALGWDTSRFEQPLYTKW